MAKISSCFPSLTISRQSASPAGFSGSQKVNLFSALARTNMLCSCLLVRLEFLKCERKDTCKNCLIDFSFQNVSKKENPSAKK